MIRGFAASFALVPPGGLLITHTLLDQVLAVGKPTIICLTAGSAIDLGKAAEKANAVLQCWYPGARGGKAVA